MLLTNDLPAIGNSSNMQSIWFSLFGTSHETKLNVT